MIRSQLENVESTRTDFSRWHNIAWHLAVYDPFCLIMFSFPDLHQKAFRRSHKSEQSTTFNALLNLRAVSVGLQWIIMSQHGHLRLARQLRSLALQFVCCWGSWDQLSNRLSNNSKTLKAVSSKRIYRRIIVTSLSIFLSVIKILIKEQMNCPIINSSL